MRQDHQYLLTAFKKFLNAMSTFLLLGQVKKKYYCSFPPGIIKNVRQEEQEQEF